MHLCAQTEIPRFPKIGVEKVITTMLRMRGENPILTDQSMNFFTGIFNRLKPFFLCFVLQKIQSLTQDAVLLIELHLRTIGQNSHPHDTKEPARQKSKGNIGNHTLLHLSY